MKQFFFLSVLILISSCATKNKSGELLQKVSTYSNDSVIAATYFSKDTNSIELAKALWQEKTKLLEGKDSSTTYYLLVFNERGKTPDITKDMDIAWSADFMHYRACCMDNGFGFVRFCYGLRYDEGRVGDWAHFRYVKNDGSLAEVQ